VPELKLAEPTWTVPEFTDPENDTKGLVQALLVALPFGLEEIVKLQVAATVETGADSALATVLSKSQLQRVLIV
jgi:hypothetical protein